MARECSPPRLLRSNHAVVQIAFLIVKNKIGVRQDQGFVFIFAIQPEQQILDNIDMADQFIVGPKLDFLLPALV